MKSILANIFMKESKFSVATYIGIFLILFTGPLLKITNNFTAVFYIIKYGIIIAILFLAIYFFLNKQILNYLKLTLFIPFTIDYQLHIAFIFLTILLFNKKLFIQFNSPLKPIYFLFGFGFLSYIINLFIELNLLSFPFFIFTFFVPFLFFGLFYNQSADNKSELLKFFNNLVLITSGIIVLQAMLYPDIHPDNWNGGTPNAHIAAAYISIALIINVIKLESLIERPFRTYFREIIISISGLPLLFLIDAKYFFILILLIMLVYFIVTPLISRKLKAISFGILLVILFIFTTTSGPLPISVLTMYSNEYNLEKVNAAFINSPRHQLIKAAVKLPSEEPLTFLIGSGPGTFISRAAFLQFNVGLGDSVKLNYGREKLPFYSGIALKNTWMRNKYAPAAFYDNHDPGSYYNRRTGLLSIYFELGIIGFMLFILFHAGIFKSALNNIREQNHYNNVLIPLIIFFFLINYFAYWCEYQNYGIIQYGILGILLAPMAKK